MTKILVVCAHPDDEVLGCGGMLARLTRIDKQEVFIGYLSYGLTSRINTPELDEVEKERVKEKSRKAIEVLTGLPRPIIKKNLRFANYPDNMFDSVPLLQITKVIEGWVDEIKPDVIFTHSNKDLNIDHRITHGAVLTATRPIHGEHIVKTIYSFQIPSSTEWSFGNYGKFNPNVFLNVTGFLHNKQEALECYDTEVREFPHPRNLLAIYYSAHLAGSVVGMAEAEAFELIRGLI
jgi:LmbE family N-acetylglucosaminyl deacetylase